MSFMRKKQKMKLLTSIWTDKLNNIELINTKVFKKWNNNVGRKLSSIDIKYKNYYKLMKSN